MHLSQSRDDMFVTYQTRLRIVCDLLQTYHPWTEIIVYITTNGKRFYYSRTPDREIPRERQCEIFRLKLSEIFGATFPATKYYAVSDVMISFVLFLSY